MQHRTLRELEAALPELDGAPRDGGTVEWLVRRPSPDEREVVEQLELDPARGVVGDGWELRPSRHTADGRPDIERQVTLMSSRVASWIAGPSEHWAAAGDNLFVDLDLSARNLPAGTELRLGGARLVITETPHTGCAKFQERFGAPALRFVSSGTGRERNLRGIHARVRIGGTVRIGDRIQVLRPHVD